MKKTVFLITVLMLAMVSTTFAQDSKVETGVIAYQQGDYGKAIDAITIGLKNKDQLKSKNVPKAYYHRGMARLKLMGQMGAKAKNMTEEEQEALGPKLQELLGGSFSDLKAAKASDDGKWTKKITPALTNMNIAFLQAGLKSLNMAYAKETKAEDKVSAFKQVVEVMGYSIEIDDASYFSYDIRGQAEMGLGDSAKAYSDFSKAATLIDGNTHKRNDLLIGYVFRNKAILERYSLGKVDDALATLETGKTMLDREFAKYDKLKAEKPAEYAKVQKQYEKISADLGKFELDLLLNAPEKLEQALEKFNKAVVAEPKNYILHIAYAQLLDKVDRKEEAAAMYGKATEIEPGNQMAWFNMGALYVNQAVALFAEANDTEDHAKATEIQTRAKEYFKKALPALEKAHEIDPCDREILRSLKQLTINLEMTEAYTKYKAKEKECKEAGK